jgi:hypothetical protein
MNGAENGIRTHDPRITNALLYRTELSRQHEHLAKRSIMEAQANLFQEKNSSASGLFDATAERTGNSAV